MADALHDMLDHILEAMDRKSCPPAFMADVDRAGKAFIVGLASPPVAAPPATPVAPWPFREQWPQPQPAQPLTGARSLSDEQADRLIAALCPDFNDEAYPNDRPVMRELARNALTAPSTPTPPEAAP